MQGALLVFLAIMITAAQTAFWRRAVLILTTIYYFYSGQFMSIFCFFSGALLADLSLSLRASSQASEKASPPEYQAEQPSVWVPYLKEYWPIATAIFALLLASVPPQDQHYVYYSRVLYFFFE